VDTSALVSPASVDKQGEYKNIVHTVGTGPCIFKERKKGESFTVTVNDKYWEEADVRHGRLPDRARGGDARA
jgi:ABC-type transport system substrate-binding protein